jgi:hypothetical protein
MSVEARILRVADIFQALAQDRPYRAGLSAARCWPPCRTLPRTAHRPGHSGHGRQDMDGAMAAALPAASLLIRLQIASRWQGRIIADPDPVSPRPENQQDE